MIQWQDCGKYTRIAVFKADSALLHMVPCSVISLQLPVNSDMTAVDVDKSVSTL